MSRPRARISRRRRGAPRLAASPGGRDRRRALSPRGRRDGRARAVRAERDHRVDHQRDHRDEQDREQRADDARPGRAQDVGRPGRRKAVRQVASPGSSAASRRSISASARCSSIDSAIQQPPRRAPGRYPLTISQEPVFIQLFWLCTSPVFVMSGLRPAPSPNAPIRRGYATPPGRHGRDGLHTYDDPDVKKLVVLEHSFYRVRYALGQSAGWTSRWRPGTARACSPRRPGTGAPAIERGAVARTFDTPGFRGMTFYEVQAKSVVNRVPEASRMPFRWTINPYRGCQHACLYCFARNSHTYLDLDAGADFDTKVVVKVNAPELVRKKMTSPSLGGRAHRDGHERGLLPARGGPLRADARHHQRAQGRRQPLLPDQGHADTQGHRAARRGGRSHRGGAQSLPGFVDKDLWRSISRALPRPDGGSRRARR